MYASYGRHDSCAKGHLNLYYRLAEMHSETDRLDGPPR